MSSILHWYVVDSDGDLTGPFTDYAEAERRARQGSAAVEEYTYEYAESQIVWTPDGSNVWPPNSDT